MKPELGKIYTADHESVYYKCILRVKIVDQFGFTGPTLIFREDDTVFTECFHKEYTRS